MYINANIIIWNWPYNNQIQILMLLKETLPLNSLKRTADECLKSNNEYTCCTMGLLMDVTGSIYRERDKDYITQLKIIDETINDEKVYGVMVKYCSVYIFSQKQTEAAFCNKIGQIVYLDHFIFSLWHNIKLQTKYLSRIQKLCCFELEGDQLKLAGMVSSADKNQAKYQHLVPRAKQLKDWFSEYFFKTYRPPLGISLMNNYTLMAEPFSIILRYADQLHIIQNIHTEKNQAKQTDQLQEFQDSNNNHFFIRKSMAKAEFPKTKYVLLRGVKCLGNFFQILLTSTGNLLGLPNQFSEDYENTMNYCAVSRFNERFLLKNHKPCLLSKITYVALKTTPIQELLKHSQYYSNRQSIREQVRIEDYFMIEAVAINFQGQLHMFHTEHQVIIHQDFIYSLSDDEKKEMIQENKISYLYEGHIGVIDRSSQRTGKLFYVHLFSNQQRSQFYDSSLITELVKEAGSDFNHDLERIVKEKIQAKLNNLIKKSSFSNTISMLLEPIKADTLIYRLTNTLFQ